MSLVFTNYETVIDSYAWIEYFRGSSSGERARDFIEKGSAATSVISLAELQEKYLREKWASFETDVGFITTKTTLVPLDRKISILAGQINFQNKRRKKDWGMADSIILSTARIASAKVITGDPHFEKDIPEAIMI